MTETNKTTEPSNKAKLALSELRRLNTNIDNPWSPSDVDKMEVVDNQKNYRQTVDACRFFYKRDPLASSVINKMVDIGINEIVFKKNGLTENEFKVFTSLKDKFREFAEEMALEYLVSGLVVPEVRYGAVTKDEVKDLGIKRYDTLRLPVSMWVRDPNSIIVNKTMISDRPTYYVEIPEDIVYFIQHEGKYPDNTSDQKLYQELLVYYPEFVEAIRGGVRKIKLENDLIFRRRVISSTPYPIPYLYSALEAMKHKRNLRRMDYTIASRVIGAIMLIKLGSDEFPVVEGDDSQFNFIKNQMLWRDSGGRDVERIFQLFGNHTLNIEWVTPPVEVLMDDAKYRDINQDIIFALGFPKILITGETDKSNTSDPQYATMSPIKTMENFRNKITMILKQVVAEISRLNDFKSVPEVSFRPLQLSEFGTFVTALIKLYDTGNLSRESFAEFFGYSFEDELDKRKVELDKIKAAGVPEFAPQPHSNDPQMGPNGEKKSETKPEPKTNNNNEN